MAPPDVTVSLLPLHTLKHKPFILIATAGAELFSDPADRLIDCTCLTVGSGAVQLTDPKDYPS